MYGNQNVDTTFLPSFYNLVIELYHVMFLESGKLDLSLYPPTISVRW